MHTDDDRDFDTDNYYGNNNKSSNDFNSNDYYGNKSSSSNSYDDVFKSFSNNDTSNNKIEKDKPKKDKKNKFNLSFNCSWKKIVYIILIIIIVVGIILLIFLSRDKIKEIADPTKEPSLIVEVLDSNISMVVGESRKINYKMTNKNDVSLLTFLSSNNSVVKVDKEGNIKAVAAGEADISISYMGEKGKVTKKCYITVRNVGN